MKLEAGMIVEVRNKRRGIVLKETIYWQNGGFLYISDYDENLKPKSNISKDNEIIKIYNFKDIHDIKNVFLDQNLKLIWERKGVDITEEEIEIAKALLKLDLKFIARDDNGEIYAYREEPRFHIDGGLWLYQSKSNGYSNVIKIEKGFEWISYGGLIKVNQILDGHFKA